MDHCLFLCSSVPCSIFLDASAAAKEFDQQHDNGDHEEDVDQVTGAWKGEHAKQPSDNQDHNEYIQYVSHNK